MNSSATWNRRKTKKMWTTWENATGRLRKDFQVFNKRFFGGLLREPVLDMDDGPVRFIWWTTPCRIFVPFTLAETKPWRLVQESLIQQLMHQQLYQERKLHPDDPEHELAFRRLCQEPRLRYALSMTFGLPGFAKVNASPEEQRLHGRIARLLALSESANTHEAAAALEEAQRLMLLHNIDLSLHSDPRRQVYAIRHLGPTLETFDQKNRLLGNILRDFFFVKLIWMNDGFDPQRNMDGHVLEISGTPSNLDMAEYVYHFLRDACERLWGEFRRAHLLRNNRGQADFEVGVLQGFRAKLYAQEKRQQVEGLVWAGDKGLDDFYTEIHPKTVPMGPVPEAEDGPLLRAGIEAGRALELRKPISEPAATPVAGALRGANPT